MQVIRYTKDNKAAWNEFAAKARNRHFFFQRDYMEYHSDRFTDCSLIFLDDRDKILALLPANISNDILYSHQGLTFGGLLVDDKMKAATMLELFDVLFSFCRQNNINKIIYKCLPHIYHLSPAEEDKYALFRHHATLIRRDITTTIDLQNKLSYQEQRARAVKKAEKNGLLFEQSTDINAYWDVLEETLQNQHNVNPVHSREEIEKLVQLFPDNIKLFVASKEGKILGGTLVYENETIAHTQYLANSMEGRNLGALDLVIDKLINTVYNHKKYFDFGISNEDGGRYLNTGLIAQKEGFGARAIAHDFYEISVPQEISNHNQQ